MLDPTLDNPRFVNLAADDYHLAEQVSTSIDAGDPARPFALEPAPNGGRIDLGAYGNTSQAALSRPAYLDLEFPSFYTDWEVALERPIVWWTFNVTGDVKIELFLEGAGKVADIGVVPAAAGQFNWSPQASGISGRHLQTLSDPRHVAGRARHHGPIARAVCCSDRRRRLLCRRQEQRRR